MNGEAAEPYSSVVENKTRIRAGQFNAVKDSRNRKIRGLWVRNGRFYLQFRVAGEKSARRVPLENKDGTAVVQFDTKTRRKKVIAFLHPFYQQKYGGTPVGTYCTAVDPAGDKLYVTWNVNRGGRAWDCCALTAIHIPESERRP